MKNFYVTEELDKTIMLNIVGGSVDGRIWCIGVKKKDKTHRVREYDGFYHVNELEEIHE